MGVMESFTMPFKVLHSVPKGQGDRYIGSLFKVDELVPDDSLTHATPQCINRFFLIVFIA